MSHEFFETVAISSASPSCEPEPHEKLCGNAQTLNPTIFQGASANGKVVFFTTEQAQLAQDTDTTNDLYAYDFRKPQGERLAEISAGEANPEHPVPGAEARVLGIVRTSADGSHVYSSHPASSRAHRTAMAKKHS
jgi:hypothetical protein